MNDRASTDLTPFVRRGVDARGVVTLTLDRPQAFNSLSEGMLAALQAELDAIAADDNVRAVVIAAGGKAFSAGHDLKEMRARPSQAYYEDLFARCAHMMLALQKLPVPVIARVQGIATAAGCQLVAACDLAVSSEDARFATPGVNIGLFCSTPMVALSRNVSRKHAMQMLLTGDLISAEDAARIGLVNEVVLPGEERAAALKLAQKIAGKSTAIVKIGKEAFYRQAEMSLADAYDYASRVMVENMLARDAEEGISAFIEKREPKWQDR